MSDIEWTDETWNFIKGCSRDAIELEDGTHESNPECDHCYAMHQVHRKLHASDVGLTKLRPKGSPRPGVDWTGKITVLPERLGIPLGWKKPRMVFVNSVSDLFHPAVPFEVIAAAFGIMAATPKNTYQILTKRPKRAAEFFAWAEADGAKQDLLRDGLPNQLLTCAWEACVLDIERINEDTRFTTPTAEVFGTAWPLPNVHLGVSAGRQRSAEAKVPVLLQLPAAVRWVSAEPLLGEVDFTKLDLRNGEVLDALRGETTTATGIRKGTRLDWLVPGGESGAKARRCDLAWIRSILKQGAAAGLPVFCKQLGANPVWYPGDDTTGYEGFPQFLDISDAKGGNMDDWPADLRVRQWPKRLVDAAAPRS